MLLLRGATCCKAQKTRCNLRFNTCSSCEEQQQPKNKQQQRIVSIHAPLARSNRKKTAWFLCFKFQYMLLLRGATRQIYLFCTNGKQSFNTCSSCEEQLLAPRHVGNLIPFQYMLLLRGATAVRSAGDYDVGVSIHAPLARSNRGNINRSGSKCKSKNRAKYQLSFVKEHYSILRFLIIV